MGINLSKGQKISLEKESGGGLTKVTMGLGWDARQAKGFMSKLFGGGGGDIDLDASAVLFNEQKQMTDTVWFGQLRSKDGAVVHTGDNMTGEGEGDDEQIIVDLSALPANVTDLVFVVSSFRGDTFDQIENAFCRIVDTPKNSEIARFQLSGGGSHTALVMARLSKGSGGWDMTAIGEPTSGRTFQDMMPAITAALG